MTQNLNKLLNINNKLKDWPIKDKTGKRQTPTQLKVFFFCLFLFSICIKNTHNVISQATDIKQRTEDAVTQIYWVLHILGMFRLTRLVLSEVL